MAPDGDEVRRLIHEVRTLFQTELARCPDAFAQYDVHKVLNEDWHVERFLRRRRYNAPQAAQMMTGALKWRKQLNLADTQPTDFPVEFYRMATVFTLGTDRRGNRMIYIRVRQHHRLKVFEQVMKQYLMWNIARLDCTTKGGPMAVVFDCNGAGLANLDLEFLWFIVSSLVNHSPFTVDYILVYELPWIFASFWTVVKRWFPVEQRNKIRFAGKDQLLDYIDRDQLPLYLGGTSPINYRQAPSGCRMAQEFHDQYTVTDELAAKLERLFRPYLDEADQETAILNQSRDVMANDGSQVPATSANQPLTLQAS